MRKTQFTGVDKTVWLSQKEMGSLSDISTDNIGRRISTILKENELDTLATVESSVVQKTREFEQKSTCAESALMGSLVVAFQLF